MYCNSLKLRNKEYGSSKILVCYAGKGNGYSLLIITFIIHSYVHAYKHDTMKK